jgi:hypothetical protein
MSTTTTALNELPRVKPKSGFNADNTTEPKTLADLGKNEKVVVNKVDSDEFMNESEFGLEKPKNMTTTGTAPGGNTTTITVSTSNAKPAINMGLGASKNLSGVSKSDKLDDGKPSIAANNKSSSENSESFENELEPATTSSAASANEVGNENEEESDEENEEEKSAAELVATAAAQIANKTLKKTSGQQSQVKLGNKTIKTTGKLLASGKQEQIMKKAMLMMNESGRLNVLTDEPTPSIVKLNTPANKAQIKLRAFRQNFERQLGEMRRKTPLQIQALKVELANIEFAEIGNKNIMAGLLELVDDHELKMLTIEKMLKQGDITLSF